MDLSNDIKLAEKRAQILDMVDQW